MNYLSIAAIFKQETKWLREWLDYHILIGVDYFYLYLHDTGVELGRVIQLLQDYKDKVYYETFPYRSGDFQVVAYNSALGNFGRYTHWLGFLDLDEFLFPVMEVKNVKEIFKLYEKDEINGLNVSVATFGDSFRETSPNSQIFDLTWRAFDHRPCNYTAKQFFRTDRIKTYEYGGNWSSCINTNYKSSANCKEIRLSDTIRVNHYPIRSTEDWIKKVQRGWPADLEKHKLEKRDWEHKYKMLNHNDQEDKSAGNLFNKLRANDSA